MTEEHLTALLKTSEAKKDPEGWFALSEGRTLSLYLGNNGVSLTITKVEALKTEGSLLRARTARGETFVLAAEDVFAGAVEGNKSGSRRAGFV